MRVSICALFTFATVALGQSASPSAQDAPKVTDSPVGASYVATLPNKEGNTVRGSITGLSSPDGKGVHFSGAFSGLPEGAGPFMYHIHEKPVPADGNCTGTGAHLDPYKRGETPACDAKTPQQCQTGDLSGKYGNITNTAGSFDYTDLYTSANPSDPSFFGSLSVVVHLSNKTRISCANFTLIGGGVSVPVPSSGTALPSGTGTPGHVNGTVTAAPTATGTGSGHGGGHESTFNPPSPTQPTAPQSSSGAERLMVAGAGLLAGAMALIL